MISEVRSTLQSKLTDASITEEAVSGRLWIDAYAAMHDSSIGKLTDIGSASVDSVQIIGVGGDFFQFHPLNMISGNVFSEMIFQRTGLCWMRIQHGHCLAHMI